MKTIERQIPCAHAPRGHSRRDALRPDSGPQQPRRRTAAARPDAERPNLRAHAERRHEDVHAERRHEDVHAERRHEDEMISRLSRFPTTGGGIAHESE